MLRLWLGSNYLAPRGGLHSGRLLIANGQLLINPNDYYELLITLLLEVVAAAADGEGAVAARARARTPGDIGEI